MNPMRCSSSYHGLETTRKWLPSYDGSLLKYFKDLFSTGIYGCFHHFLSTFCFGFGSRSLFFGANLGSCDAKPRNQPSVSCLLERAPSIWQGLPASNQMCWDGQIVQVSGTHLALERSRDDFTSKSLESSVKYPKKILGIHNVPKRTKRIQKACSCMSLSTCFMKQNLPTEPFPWWLLEVFIPGLYRFQATHPMLAHATSCKIVRTWFCSKNYVEETHWNMVSIRFWPMPNWIELPFCWNSAITGPLYCWERSVCESYDAALDLTDKGELGWDD